MPAFKLNVDVGFEVNLLLVLDSITVFLASDRVNDGWPVLKHFGLG